MNTFKKNLSNRIAFLSKIANEKRSSLQHAPEGTLRINMNGKYPQYYLRRSTTDKNGSYLSVKEISQICALAQKDYDWKVLRAAEKELTLLKRLQTKLSFSYAEEVYPLLNRQKQKLVSPIELPDEEFIRQWKSQPYISKAFDENTPEHYTSRGERVRSKSEVLIANTLADLNIPYLYEKPLYLGSRLVHPDFTILNVKTRNTMLLEHLGMMDDPDYAEAAVSRLLLYIQHDIVPGKHLLLTFETRNSPLNTRILKKQLESLCF